MKNYWIVAIILLAICTSCNKKDELDPEKDYILIKAFGSARNQSDKEIDIETLKNCALLYEKNKENGKVCLCDALIGYKLFTNGDFDKSLIHLKKAEANLEYCDSMSAFVYGYIVQNTMTTDTILALNYAKKALEKDLEYNDPRKLPYSYMDMSLLTKGDSAQYYLRKSLEYFDDWGDKIAKCKYAWWHIDELHPDTIIAYAKPCYDSIQYTGHARIFAEAYLRKEEPDSALEYIKHVAVGRHLKPDYYFYNSRRLALLGKYKEASESWEEAYRLQRQDFSFMFSQRLGAINAEYDLLNAELKNEKERLRMMRGYNVTLTIALMVVIITVVIIMRYKKSIAEMEKEIVRQRERFNTLFEEYKKGYDLNKERIFSDAQTNLKSINEDYPSLSKTDLAIVWLTFMQCEKDMLCQLLSISSKYYYNRKSTIQRTLNVQINDTDDAQKEIEKIVKKYICKKTKIDN